MTVTVTPGERSGAVRPPASKSQAHRLLICAALGETAVELECDGVSKDIAATAACLNALGANIAIENDLIRAEPIRAVPSGLCRLPCGESGSAFSCPWRGPLARRRCSSGRVVCRSGRWPLWTGS